MDQYNSRETKGPYVVREPEWISGKTAEKLRSHMWTESLSG